MKTTGGPPPEWAVDLVHQVCADAGRRPPKIQWWNREASYSSGHQYPARKLIHITAGTSLEDQRETVFHEVTHHLCPPKWHHNKRFYVRLFSIIERYDPTLLQYAYVREADYMKRSTLVSGLPA